MNNPAVITAAITGSTTPTDRTPHIPLSVDEIVAATVESWRAGAAVVHVHAREADGTPTQDGEIYARIVDRIQDSGCTAILNLSTGSAGGYAGLDERLAPLALDPEMASLDCGTMNFGDDRIFENPFWFLRETAQQMKDRQIVPEIEVFDGGMIVNGKRLIEEGLIEGPGVWQLCLGVRGGAPADIQTISYFQSQLPAGATWSLLGVGRHQVLANMLSLVSGGHIRTGLEDNIYFRPGELATSNAQLVARVVRVAEEIGRPVATPDEARELLGIRSRATAA